MNEELIRKYYSLVDGGQYEDMLLLFSDNITYIRAGKFISGKEDLRKFYLYERGLIGIHTILSVHNLNKCVIVEGVFHGVNSCKENITIPFVDIFELEQNHISQRRTYLGVMSQLIE